MVWWLGVIWIAWLGYVLYYAVKATADLEKEILVLEEELRCVKMENARLREEKCCSK